jgi:hypothetical protein
MTRPRGEERFPAALTRCVYVAFFAAVIVFATGSIGYPQVPKADDIVACNAEAQRAVHAGASSAESPLPMAKDHTRAADARSTTRPGQHAGAASDDAQLSGMNTEGAKDPAYQAAYRTCMRKAGF